MAQLFRKHEMMKEYETKYENNLLSLHICNSGTVFDREIACVKACFYFDRRHSLDEVVDSVSATSIFQAKILTTFDYSKPYHDLVAILLRNLDIF